MHSIRKRHRQDKTEDASDLFDTNISGLESRHNEFEIQQHFYCKFVCIRIHLVKTAWSN
jgi:hypothetical protein